MNPRDVLEDHESRIRLLESTSARLLGSLALIVFEIPIVVSIVGVIVVLYVKSGGVK